MQSKCIVCGKLFTKSPSNRVVTCSRECLRIRRSEVLSGHPVSDSAKEKISSAAKQRGFTDNLAKGTPAAQNSPKGGRFDTNASAKSWVLISPDNQRFNVINLNNWIRNNINYFDCEPTDKNVLRIAAGFRVIKRNIKLNRGGQTYKGWTIEKWNDLRNCERNVKMKIKANRFKEITLAAQGQPDLQLFLAEYGLPEWILTEITENEQEAINMIINIHHVTHLTIGELIKEAKLSQSAFSRRFGIPLRTVQHWVSGDRECPDYILLMAAEILGILKIERQP